MSSDRLWSAVVEESSHLRLTATISCQPSSFGIYAMHAATVESRKVGQCPKKKTRGNIRETGFLRRLRLCGDRGHARHEAKLPPYSTYFLINNTFPSLIQVRFGMGATKIWIYSIPTLTPMQTSAPCNDRSSAQLSPKRALTLRNPPYYSTPSANDLYHSLL